MKTILSSIFILIISTAYAQQEDDSITKAVTNYHEGFVTGNINKVRSSIDIQLIMTNGNHSNNPIDWQAHQFLNGKDIDEWIEMMINNAGPFENSLIIKNVDVRNNSAIVVTQEKGQNKFRSWDKEEVVYSLGKVNNHWKIVSIYIKNLKNPE